MMDDDSGTRSYVVIDPKGEVGALTSNKNFRRKVGDVKIINPYGLLADQRPDTAAGVDCWNPLVDLEPVRVTPCPHCGRRELWLYRDSGGKVLNCSTREFVCCFSYWIECPGCRCRTAEGQWYADTAKQAAIYWGGVAGDHWFVPVGRQRRSLLRSTAAQMRAGTLSRREVVAR